jgi:hypothetical protein
MNSIFQGVIFFPDSAKKKIAQQSVKGKTRWIHGERKRNPRNLRDATSAKQPEALPPQRESRQETRGRREIRVPG